MPFVEEGGNSARRMSPVHRLHISAAIGDIDCMERLLAPEVAARRAIRKQQREINSNRWLLSDNSVARRRLRAALAECIETGNPRTKHYKKQVQWWSTKIEVLKTGRIDERGLDEGAAKIKSDAKFVMEMEVLCLEENAAKARLARAETDLSRSQAKMNAELQRLTDMIEVHQKRIDRANVAIVKPMQVPVFVNCADSCGRTAVWFAVERGHLETVLLLHKRSANMDFCNHVGQTLFSCACENGAYMCSPPGLVFFSCRLDL